MKNTLLTPWDTPYGVPQFSMINDTDFEEAFTQAMTNSETNFTKITQNIEPPTFKNTIEEMERGDRELDQVSRIFFNLVGTDSNPKRNSIQTKISPMLAAFNSKVLTNNKLWERVSSVYERRNDSNLTKEQIRVSELYYEMFTRAGAVLSETKKKRYTAIMQNLAELGTKFSQNLLSDESSWCLSLDESQLEGLPDFVINSMSQAALDRDVKGYALTLSRSILEPFLQFSSNRKLREIAHLAWSSRGMNGGDTDNINIAKETLSLRTERANILGYNSFADFKLENQMAKNPKRVRDLLMAVWEPAKKKANIDAKNLQKIMLKDGNTEALKAWDWRYYAEKYKQTEYSLDETEIKPYFQLDKMIEASFHCANKLFNLEFKPIKLDLYHPDAKAWEVSRSGNHVAIFIGDYYARSSKRSGAWCSSLRGQSKFDGLEHPIAINVCNFTKPKHNQACLLSFQDAATLFHEFGHALHVMLSDVTYPFISCTSVSRDFVELPSQLFEHWLEVPEVLNMFALHFETGEPMPPSLVKKLLKARNADQGFSTVEYISSALVDLTFHEQRNEIDPIKLQDRVLTELNMPEAIGMRHATPNFSHIFSGDGYSSGYYSYMWSEVMDSDAFMAFTEIGDPFDTTTAQLLHDCIYSSGGSSPAEDLYIKFRGAMPGVSAILEQRGLNTD